MSLIIRKIFHVSIIIVFIVGGLFLFSQNSQSYNDKTTHPGLTDEMVDFYNLSFDDKLTDQEKEWIVQGSIDEDIPPRWINHFYDPTTGEGWKAENLGDLSPRTLKIFSKIFLNNNTEIVSSKNWVHNETLQLKYQDYDGNRTWENAIRRYVNGDKEYAYKTLGNILHLLEDKTVPDHTRNDTHAHEGSGLTKDGGSPYEDYSSGWNRWNLTTAQDLKSENKSPIIFNSINEYIDYLANYSNNYFFSEHTIKSEKYENPKILREVGRYGYGKDKNGEEFALVEVRAKTEDDFIAIKSYSLENEEVLKSYFSRLSREAVLNGTGVIKLFKNEVAKAEKDKSLIKEEPKIYWWQKMRSPLYGVIIPAYNSGASIVNGIKNYFSDSQPIDPTASVANIGQQLENLDTNQTILEQDNITLAEEQQIIDNEIAQSVQSNQQIISENQNDSTQQQSQLSPTPSEPEIVHAPYYRAPEVIHAPYQSSVEQTQNNNQIPGVITNQFQGQFNGSFAPAISDDEENQSQNTLSSDQDNVEANSQQDHSTDSTSSPQASSGQDPSINSGQEAPINSDQDSEPGPQPEPVPEPILPDVNFYLTDYNVRKFDFTLNWQDRNSVAQNWELQYKLAPSFAWQSIVLANSSLLTANSFDFIAEYDDLTYYFRIRAQYDGGIYTDWLELPVDISSKPVAINEVAWMGTQASTSDEWIELANKTNQEIDLAGWTIRSQENPPRINIFLNGKIAPNGYYLLERTDDDPVLGIVADQIYTGALNNSSGPGDYGQQLTLNDEGNNEIDKIHTAYAGDNETKQTAERVSIWAFGDEKTNWKTSQSSLGTPKSQNSQADLYFLMSSVGNYQTPKNVVLLKDRGPYITNSAVSIYPQSNLIIEPGTVLKFDYYGSLNIFGNLIAKGTAEEKIIFTSLKDDENGGDANGDGDATTAQKGDWMNVTFSENSGGEMDYAEFRYGVNIWTKNGVNNWSKSNVYIEKANVKISNSLFENSGGDALAIFNDPEAISPAIQLAGNEFKNNGGRGVAIAYANDLEIANNTFADNGEAGIWLGAPGGWRTDLGNINILGNTFTNNKAPMEINKFADFSISGNSMSSNANNGVLVYGGSIAEAKDSVTVSSDMPFVFLDSGTVREGKTLNLSPGTVFKFSQTAFGIYGTLNAVGTPDQPIVFTALEDDSYGGDTNNDGNATMPGEAAWYWMQFVSGENSTLDNVTVRYAGRIGYSMGGPPSGGSGIAVEPGVSNFTLRNSTISDSVIGATISSDGATIENTVFSNNDQTGLNISANNATISNVAFENNQKAFQSVPHIWLPYYCPASFLMVIHIIIGPRI